MFGTGVAAGHPNMQAHLNQALATHNPNYKALYVSWNDNQRQQGSCFGSNITDARLKGKDGEDFLVVRPNNFNERIGRVKAADVALLVGSGTSLRPVTLEEYLRDFHSHAVYAGSVPAGTSLLSATRDQSVGIRFQAVFLPVASHSSIFGTTGPKAKEFYPDTYNYQTKSWEDPRNLVLLCTSQGTFVQQDGPGSVPQFLHSSELGGWRKKYLEAAVTRHGVIMGQTETAEERAEALRQGKAASTVIGTRAMGAGFNRLMTVQIPMKQQRTFGANLFGGPSPTAWAPTFPSSTTGSCFGGGPMPAWGLGGLGCAAGPCSGAPAPMAFGNATGAPFGGASCQAFGSTNSSCQAQAAQCDNLLLKSLSPSAGAGLSQSASAHAARVSTGSDAGPMDRLRMERFERDEGCSVTITVQFYFVVREGYGIDESDIRRAVDICEEAYKGCSWDGNLMDAGFQSAFAKKDMTPSDTLKLLSPPSSVLVFPGSNSLVPKPTWSQPPCPSAPSKRFDPLAGLDQDLKALLCKVPLTQEGYGWLHGTALSLLEQKQQLDAAFHIFRLANDMHLQIHGLPDGHSLYNMACCQAVVVSLQIQQYRSACPGAFDLASCLQVPEMAGGVVAPHLPPKHTSGASVAMLCDARLDAAVGLLSSAIGAGWRQHAHMATDPDLQSLREIRKPRFDVLVKLAQSTAQAFA